MLRTTAKAVAKVNKGRPILFIVTLHLDFVVADRNNNVNWQY
jgi:hypothetical protein